MPNINARAALVFSALALALAEAHQMESDGKLILAGFDEHALCLTAFIFPDGEPTQNRVWLCEQGGCAHNPGEQYVQVRLFSFGPAGDELHAQIPGYDYCLSAKQADSQNSVEWIFYLELSGNSKCAKVRFSPSGVQFDNLLIVDPDDGSDKCAYQYDMSLSESGTFRVLPKSDTYWAYWECAPYWKTMVPPEPAILGDFHHQYITNADDACLTVFYEGGGEDLTPNVLLCDEANVPAKVNTFFTGNADPTVLMAKAGGTDWCLVLKWFDADPWRGGRAGWAPVVSVADHAECSRNYVSEAGHWRFIMDDGVDFCATSDEGLIYVDSASGGCDTRWMRKSVQALAHLVV